MGRIRIYLPQSIDGSLPWRLCGKDWEISSLFLLWLWDCKWNWYTQKKNWHVFHQFFFAVLLDFPSLSFSETQKEVTGNLFKVIEKSHLSSHWNRFSHWKISPFSSSGASEKRSTVDCFSESGKAAFRQIRIDVFFLCLAGWGFCIALPCCNPKASSTVQALPPIKLDTPS